MGFLALAMRWDIILAVVVALAALFWWKFVRIPTALAAIKTRVPLSVTWRQLTDGTFMMHQSTEERRRLTVGAPMSLQWAFGWIVHVHDVEIALDVVRHSPSVWQQVGLPSAPWSLARQLWGTGLPVSNNPHWKVHRTIAMHAFSNDSLRHIHELSFLPTGKQLGDTWHKRLVDAGGKQTAVDVTEELGIYNLLSLGRAAFGFEFEDVNARNLVNTAIDKILQPSRYIPGSLYDLLPNEANRSAKDALTRLNTMVHKLIRNRREFHRKRLAKKAEHEAQLKRAGSTSDLQAEMAAENAAYKPILMDHLLTGQDEHGVSLTDEEVRDETLVFFLAGLDTSQLALSTAIWFLAHNPDAQRHCYEEVVRVCGEHIVLDPTWTGPSYEDVKKMHYMLACIWESVRLYRLFQPVRANNQPAKVGGVELPAGTMVVIDVWSLHRSEKYWGDNADRFHPERWLEGYESGDDALEPRARFHPDRHSFFAFGGGGPRSCVGQNFTIGWQRVALSFLLSHFQFSPKEAPQTQVLGDGKSSDLKFYSKGLFSVPIVSLNITPRPGFGQAPSPRPQLRHTHSFSPATVMRSVAANGSPDAAASAVAPPDPAPAAAAAAADAKAAQS